jgi:hypothetical protein
LRRLLSPWRENAGELAGHLWNKELVLLLL